MKTKKFTLIIVLTSLTSIGLFAQGGNIGNFRLPANFLGFNAGIPGELNIRNDFNNHIAFFTAGPNNTRMRIFGNGLSPSCPLGGGIGINPNPANPITAPGSFLHIGLTTLLIH